MKATKEQKKFASGFLCLLCLFAAGISSSTYAQISVTKVDPPSWWTKHTINPIRLLVRGTNLRGAHVTSLYPALRVSDVKVNDRGTYLFLDLEIGSSLYPGVYT